MNAERLLALFDRVADAPDAIPRLRRFVLDLAVRGRLVEQDPGDEPAEELPKWIEADKATIQASAQSRERSTTLGVDREAYLFVPPPHWVWVRLIDIAQPTYGFAFPSSEFNRERRGLPLIRIRDIAKTDAEAYYDGAFDPSYLVRSGECLVGMDGNFSLRRWRGPDGLLNQRVMRITGWRMDVEPEFVKMPLQMALDVLHGNTSQTTVKHLSAKQVNGIEVPLPPLAEQRRIVARVEELMGLLDRLHLARSAREATRDRLNRASLTLLSSNGAAPVPFPNVTQAALDALQAVTARRQLIVSVRQTILSLAVSGRLTEQEPSDGPARRLLDEPVDLPAGYVRRRKVMKVGGPDHAVGPLGSTPPSWECVQIQELYDANIVIDYGDGNHGSLYPRSHEFGPEGVPFVSAKDLADGRVNWGTCSKLGHERAQQLVKGWAQAGDVLLTHNATVGRIARVDEHVAPFLLGTSVTFYRLNREALCPDYFFYVLMSPVWQHQLHGVMEQTTRNQVSIQKQAQLSIPLPPLVEQHRIVARVDALMTLCDRLEAALTAADSTQQRLLEALVHQALAIDASPRGDQPKHQSSTAFSRQRQW